MEAEMGKWKDMFNNAVGALTFGDCASCCSTGNNTYIANYLQQWPEQINKKI